MVESTEKAILSLGDTFNEIVDKLYSDSFNNSDDNAIHIAEIHEKVDEILFTLQFQDATRQIMEHVQNDLRMISKEFNDANNIIKEELGVLEVKTDDIDCFSTYTMEQERDHYQQPKTTSSDKNEDNDDQITFL